MPIVKIPGRNGGIESYTVKNPPLPAPEGGVPQFNRIAYSAAHVVADPLADNDPWLDVSIDWERTIAFRHYLWDLGLGVAEAMDTAQRGMGLDWAGAAAADPPGAGGGLRPPGRPDRLRRRHRPSGARPRRHRRRRDPRLRGADRHHREHGRAGSS